MVARSLFLLSLAALVSCASARETALKDPAAENAAAEEVAAADMFGQDSRFAQSASLWVDVLADNVVRIPFDDDRASPHFVAQLQSHDQEIPKNSVRPREFLNLVEHSGATAALVLEGDLLIATFPAPAASAPVVVARDVDVERALQTPGPVALEVSNNIAPLPASWLEAADARTAPAFIVARGVHDDRTLKTLADTSGARYLYGEDAPDAVRLAAFDLQLELELESGFVRALGPTSGAATVRGGFLLDGEVATWVIRIERDSTAPQARATFRFIDKDGVAQKQQVALVHSDEASSAARAWRRALALRGAL